MTRDFYNPLLLLIIIILLACRISHVGDAGSIEVWVMGLCATGFALDGSLSMARAMTQRPAIMNVVWAVVFLLVGCCTWVMATSNQGAEEEELAEYRAMYANYKQDGNVNARNENDDTLLFLAVECGKENVVRTLLKHRELTADQVPEAALRASTAERTPELSILLDAGLAVDAAPAGVPLLCAAAAHGNTEAVTLLLSRGASPTVADDAGVSALSNAVSSGNVRIVRKLREAGASADTPDADGRTPSSYSRSEKMDEALR